jgi:hypothetical protein
VRPEALPSMLTASQLRLKAAQCRRLGAGQDPRTLLALTVMSDEYEAEAQVLDVTKAEALTG